ncbi:MAG: hypothetical protein U0939_14850 [Pirellulales bacterium]
MFRTSVVKTRLFIAARFLLVIVLSFEAMPCLALGAEIRIKPDRNVDQRLFLTYLLKDLYDNWPADASDESTFVAAASESRSTAIRWREHCRREKLGAELEACFNEYIQTLDAYTRFLANIGQIKKAAAEQAMKDEFNAGFKGGASGAGTYGAMRQGDFSHGESAVGALLVGGIEYLVDSWQKAEKRDAAEKQAVEIAARNIKDRIATSLENAKAAARKLTKENGWGKAEAGIVDSEQTNAALQKVISLNDKPAHLRFLDEEVKKRPRDPFVRLARNVIASVVDKDNPTAVQRHAQDCVVAASLVPEGQIFDEYREGCVALASYLALSARSAEAMAGIKPYGSTKTSEFALSCIDWLSQNSRTVPTGALGEARSTALLCDGQVNAAFEQANKVFELQKNEASFLYLYACIMSRLDRTDEALKFLNGAINQGVWDIPPIKRDPDLENLRRKQVKGFAEAIKVKAEWNIVYGFFNDDITVTNNSKFPITGVVVDVLLEQDGKQWTPQLKADVIMPGATYTWANVVSIPGSRVTKSFVRLKCDQDK